MFSSRLHWDLRPNRLAEAQGAKRRQGAEILDLTESNPTRAGLAYPAKEILAALGDGRALVYEPAPAGLHGAREAVARDYAARGWIIDPARIFITASTSESYAWLFKLLADADDEVLVPRPSYPLFEFLARMELARAVEYPLVYHDGWAIDLDALGRAIGERTRAIVLVNPNNPTGSFVKRGELERLVELAAERNLALISDEVFSDYAFGPDAERVESLTGVEGALTFCLSGLSKLAGLPQLKLGWIVTGGPAALRAEATERLELIADTYLSVGTPVQLALPRLLESGARAAERIGERLRRNLAALDRVLARIPGTARLPVEGGWSAVLRIGAAVRGGDLALELLETADVLVQPGWFFDFEEEDAVVVSLLPLPADFDEGIARLVGALA